MRTVSIVLLMVVGVLVFGAALPAPACAEEVPTEYRATVSKGLEWLACHQNSDGHWEANGGKAPVVMTALGGMALLMEGSTIREGKYHDNIRRAVDWLMRRSQPNGLINNPEGSDGENNGYMYGHGFAILFLSNVVAEEEDADRRRKLVEILDRAAQFSHNAQSSRGGWYCITCQPTTPVIATKAPSLLSSCKGCEQRVTPASPFLPKQSGMVSNTSATRPTLMVVSAIA